MSSAADMEHSEKICSRILDAGLQVGIAIKASTGIARAKEFISRCLDKGLKVSTILLLTIPRHIGGLPLLPMVLDKVTELRSVFKDINIQVSSALTRDIH